MPVFPSTRQEYPALRQGTVQDTVIVFESLLSVLWPSILKEHLKELPQTPQLLSQLHL